MSNWHNEVHQEAGWTGIQEGEGWFAELRARKIREKQLCGVCGEWPEYCDCEHCDCGTLNSESGKIERSACDSPFAGMPLCKHKIQFDCDQCKQETAPKLRPGQCQYCGTRTGQHGFSFDMERR